MKESTKRGLAAISAAIMSAWFSFNGVVQLGQGNLGHALFGIVFGLGMAATFIAIFKKPTDGKLYNTAILLGGLPSLGFIILAIWIIFDGSFRPNNLFQIIVGVVGLLTVNVVISKAGEIEESAAEANE